MITWLRVSEFKNFADETLHVGPFTLIVGANASGKSNIRDAFRFLQGIGRGYTLPEIIGGKYGADWKPIRGSAGTIIRFSASEHPRQGAFTIDAGMCLSSVGSTEPPRNAMYTISVIPETHGIASAFIAHENLWITSGESDGAPTLEDADMGYDRTQSMLLQHMRLELKDREYENAKAVFDEFTNMRFFDFAPDRLRDTGVPGNTKLGDSGENLPTVLQKICADGNRKAVLIDWVRELTPMDVADLEFHPDASDKIHLIIRERHGSKVSAASASDGTLRFLAMLAALLSEDAGGLYFFEEIENGLHPSRLHLLVDLIERQTAKGRVQVIATTHSPDLLSMVNGETFENIAVTCRLEDTNDAIIRRVADLHNARKLRSSQGLGRLLAGGWMEDALAFTEGDDEEDRE